MWKTCLFCCLFSEWINSIDQSREMNNARIDRKYSIIEEKRKAKKSMHIIVSNFSEKKRFSERHLFSSGISFTSFQTCFLSMMMNRIITIFSFYFRSIVNYHGKRSGEIRSIRNEDLLLATKRTYRTSS